MKTTDSMAIVAALALTVAGGCGKSKQERECEKLEDRVVKISAGVTLELYKLEPGKTLLGREALESEMRRTLDQGTFMQECLKLEPGEVECLANSTTKAQWQACGFDDVQLP